MSKSYRGVRYPDGSLKVTCLHTGKLLPDRFEEVQFYPGFAVGVHGPGSAQLAYALLHDYKGPEYARAHYNALLNGCIAYLPLNTVWTLTEEEIDTFFRRMYPRSALERIVGDDFVALRCK